MSFVYVVIENSDLESPGGGVFPNAYTTFEKAKAAAIRKYQDELHRQIDEFGDDSAIMMDVDVPESETGCTSLYIEKGIHMFIHKLPVKISGGKRSSSVQSRRRKTKQ
jgi:hypothetical protein